MRYLTSALALHQNLQSTSIKLQDVTQIVLSNNKYA